MQPEQQQQPDFVPEYNKPEGPGIWMNFDNTVSLYLIVEKDDSFQDAAQKAIDMVKEAQERFPEWPRVFYLDIQGHEGEHLGFSEDFFEFQQEFFFSTIAHFVTAFELPATGGMLNPESQRNDVPDELVVKLPGEN